jgi:hypothetical protein
MRPSLTLTPEDLKQLLRLKDALVADFPAQTQNVSLPSWVARKAQLISRTEKVLDSILDSFYDTDDEDELREEMADEDRDNARDERADEANEERWLRKVGLAG